jgi:drug/metabolite transporter (DMT)-like permease
VTALLLVLASAALHATWNFLAKRAASGMVFTWLFSLIAMLVYTPFVVSLVVSSGFVFTPLILGSLAINGTLHFAYYWLLARGYRAGDLSLVYPLARGTGPLLASVGAILLLGERPGLSVVLGAVLVSLGVIILTGNPLAVGEAQQRPAIAYGLLVGVSIAGYTLWDKVSVSDLLIPPLMVIWVSTSFRVLVFTPYVIRHRHELKPLWERYKREALGIGVLDTLGYLLFLVALQTTDVSLLAPLRQMSILFGAILGIRLLGEAGGWRRGVASGVMVMGVIVVALQR